MRQVLVVLFLLAEATPTNVYIAPIPFETSVFGTEFRSCLFHGSKIVLDLLLLLLVHAALLQVLFVVRISTVNPDLAGGEKKTSWFEPPSISFLLLLYQVTRAN